MGWRCWASAFRAFCLLWTGWKRLENVLSNSGLSQDGFWSKRNSNKYLNRNKEDLKGRNSKKTLKRIRKNAHWKLPLKLCIRWSIIKKNNWSFLLKVIKTYLFLQFNYLFNFTTNYFKTFKFPYYSHSFKANSKTGFAPKHTSQRCILILNPFFKRPGLSTGMKCSTPSTNHRPFEARYRSAPREKEREGDTSSFCPRTEKYPACHGTAKAKVRRHSDRYQATTMPTTVASAITIENNELFIPDKPTKLGRITLCFVYWECGFLLLLASTFQPSNCNWKADCVCVCDRIRTRVSVLSVWLFLEEMGQCKGGRKPRGKR